MFKDLLRKVFFPSCMQDGCKTNTVGTDDKCALCRLPLSQEGE